MCVRRTPCAIESEGSFDSSRIASIAATLWAFSGNWVSVVCLAPAELSGFCDRFCQQNLRIVAFRFPEDMSLSIPHTLIDDSLYIASFCYGIMSQAIRSEIDKQIISLCCRVLLNLARYKPTQQSVVQVKFCGKTRTYSNIVSHSK